MVAKHAGAPGGREGGAVLTLAPGTGDASRCSLVVLARRASEAIDDLARAIRPPAGATPSPRATPEDLRETIALLDAAATAVGVARAEALTRIQAEGAWQGLDRRARDFADWRARSTRGGRGAALGEQRTAATLAQLPTVRDATRDGAVTLGHVEAIAQVLGSASDRTRERLLATEKQILHAAQVLPVPDLRKQLRAVAAALDADSADHEFDAVRSRRFLRLSSREGGLRIEGLLDPVAGEVVRTALDALTPVPAADDSRSSEQRRADALEHLASRTLSSGDTRAGAQVRPHLSVVVPVETWQLLTVRRQQLRGSDGVSTGGPGDQPETRSSDPAGRTSRALRASGLAVEPPLAQLLDGTPLSFAALDVLACDALLQRVVIDAEGTPLDVGRSKRTFEDDLRRAILVRDRHCQFPDCGLRAVWCEVHHLHHWQHGGATSLANGITLCSRHHHLVHRENVVIRPVEGGFVFTEADGRRIGVTARLHERMLVPRRAVAAGRSTTPPGAAASSRGAPPEPPDDRPGRPPPPGGTTIDRRRAGGTPPETDPGALW